MVNYYLSNSKRNSDEVLNLEKLLGKNSKNLELIDELTTSFENENELKEFLLLHAVLSYSDINKEIIIKYKNNGKYKKLPVFYANHRKIKESFDKIKERIETRENNFNAYTSEEIKYRNLNKIFPEFSNLILNINFMKNLSEHYTNESIKYNKQGVNIGDINIYLSDVRQNDGVPFLSNYVYIALYELFKNAIFKLDKKNNKLKTNYRGYRDLINFIYKYKLSVGLIEEKNNEQLTLDDYEELEKEFNNTKELCNTNISKEEYAIYEDGFPPNSEELMQYKNYLEQLNNKANGKKR